MVKKAPVKILFLAIPLLLVFFGLELSTATPLAPFPINVRYNTNQIKNPSASDLCHLKNHVNQARYYYKKPYFFSTGGYKGYNTGLLFLQRPTGLLRNSNRGTFQLIGLEANLHPLKTEKILVEWYEYQPHRNGPDLSKLCLPHLHKGKCLFKVVYRGQDMKVNYKNTSSFDLLKGTSVRAQVYSGKKAIIFPQNCNN